MLQLEQRIRRAKCENAEAKHKHAEWAGESLAEFVVARHLKLERLGPTKIEKMRKRYHVAPELVGKMLQIAKETIPHEMVWQYAHS